MIRKNLFLPRLIDPFSYLGPKARKQLDQSWAETFRRHILPHLPVEELSKEYHQDFGRPSKNLHSGLGVLVLQQMNDTTDQESIQRLAFDTRWHYALNISGTTDDEVYMCERTLVDLRQKAIQLGLVEKLFAQASDGLLAAGGVDGRQQRMDSVHVKSNMRRLGRVRLVGRVIQVFLKNMRRKDPEGYARVAEEIRKRYMGLAKGEEIFSRVKPSETTKTLAQAAQDLADLVEQFGGEESVVGRKSYRMLQRVLGEQCRLVEEAGEQRVAVKGPKKWAGIHCRIPRMRTRGIVGIRGKGIRCRSWKPLPRERRRRPG